MASRFRHAALVGKYQAHGIRPVLEEIAHFLVRQGLEVSLEKQTAQSTGITGYGAFTNDVTAQVTGIILAKLDSSAKGGMAFAIQKELGLPILFAGLGERPEDLQPFDRAAFVDGVLGLKN